ncbi:conserved hypothetical protein [Flavobacterium sp. 9AF]|uniref:hypothetical protein n=1 Tax=Flavobacterium sp. 9AF TaxID=2653142 RepID=UPI0012EF199C|nr:hypothetical protein [Flavobacterium sp. 9AF]VXC20007.1 conserved hypothetical protein [Flavobacterium sp. 9AF]
MKTLLSCCFLLVLLSCKTNETKTEVALVTVPSKEVKSQKDSVFNLGPKPTSNPYEVKLDIHQKSDAIYDLEIQMLLYNNAYYASSNTKKDFKGKFTFSVDETPSFTLKNNLIETPLLIQENNSESKDPSLSDWIRVNTYYKQQLEVNTTVDFIVRGFIQFTIEPRCTLEKIPVIIKSEKGMVKFEIDRC